MNENDKSLEERLGVILSDPNAMSTIMNIVKGLGNAKGASNLNENHEVKSESFAPKTEELPAIAFAQPSYNNDNKSLALLLALKPFLSHERAHKLDTLTGLLRVLSLTDFLR